MTKSPLLVAQEALRVARRSLPEDASGFSRRDYTRHQLFALLVLRKFFRTALRGDRGDGQGVVRSPEGVAKKVLQLSKVPDHSTLWHVEQKLLGKGG